MRFEQCLLYSTEQFQQAAIHCDLSLYYYGLKEIHMTPCLTENKLKAGYRNRLLPINTKATLL